MSRYTKTATVGGVVWTILSRNERECTVDGRHFMAGRCNSKRAWQIHEHDQRLTEHGRCKTLRRWRGFETGQLSIAVHGIVKGMLEHMAEEWPWFPPQQAECQVVQP